MFSIQGIEEFFSNLFKSHSAQVTDLISTELGKVKIDVTDKLKEEFLPLLQQEIEKGKVDLTSLTATVASTVKDVLAQVVPTTEQIISSPQFQECLKVAVQAAVTAAIQSQTGGIKP